MFSEALTTSRSAGARSPKRRIAINMLLLRSNHTDYTDQPRSLGNEGRCCLQAQRSVTTWSLSTLRKASLSHNSDGHPLLCLADASLTHTRRGTLSLLQPT